MLPIFLISDENYIKYATVTIKSILSGTNEKISFYILDGGITKDSKEKIEKSVEHTTSSVEFIQIDVSLFSKFPDIAHFSINTYFRYLIPILKPQIHKALYVDTDMVINGDIAEIYNTDLDNYGLAAVPYLTEELHLPNLNKDKNILGLSPKHLYFNAGLLLINCDYWRSHDISKVLMDKTAEMYDKLSMPDQDVLNVVFKDNYKILPKQYNLIVDTTMQFFNFKEYIKAFKGCLVLHYTGGKEFRPWMRAKVPCYQRFWDLAKETPFYNDLLIDLVFNFMDRVDRLNDNNNVKNIKLFGFIPFLKICKEDNIQKIYLFNLILLFKTKTKELKHK